MRPIKTQQNALEAPLNRILGTEANVRILRELCLAGGPLARTELASRAELSVPGVFAALEKLRRTGIVSFVGAGARQAVQLREEHPLHAWLAALFQAEAARGAALADELRAVIERTELGVRAAWTEAHAGEPDRPLTVGVLAAARKAASLAGALREAVGAVERRYDVTVELRVWTGADLLAAGPEEKARLEKATPLLGPHPLTYADASRAPAAEAPRKAVTHEERERQALRTAAWIARRLDRDPTLPRRARSWLVHRTHRASEREANELAEWLHLLDTASIPRLQYVLLDPGEWPTRLRQSNPFLPALTDAERAALQAETER
ncbi:MAG TPA: hypothetical protein VF746_05950 [Longimicrobium sp.]|jgi:hypothetical protein